MPGRPYKGESVSAWMAPLALGLRPELAAEIAIVASVWSEIQHKLGAVFAAILGTDAELGIAIFLELRSEGPQYQIIRKIAGEKLPAELAKDLVFSSIV